jgi:hypothetical protein
MDGIEKELYMKTQELCDELKVVDFNFNVQIIYVRM